MTSFNNLIHFNYIMLKYLLMGNRMAHTMNWPGHCLFLSHKKASIEEIILFPAVDFNQTPSHGTTIQRPLAVTAPKPVWD
jgi:hypothetical protein